MNPCQQREPKVIDNALLEKCIKEQGPKGEAGRLAELEGIPFDDVTQIRLEFMNILKIDHLWVLKSLTKLSLNNNLLEKIENLDSLVNLTELDFSFNKITKIENLDKLVKVEKLIFFDNKISVLENMEMLKQLTIFSVGRNLISDLSNVLYLRQFNNLKSLNMVENPCAKAENFRYYIAIFLPQILYYEYKLVREEEKQKGKEIFGSKLRSLEDTEAKEREKREKIEQERLEAELNSLSFVEYLNTTQLFDFLFEDDNDGKTLLGIGEDAEEFFDEYQEQFNAICKQVFDVGQVQFKVRQAEHGQYIECVKEAQKKNQEEGIAHMEIYLEKKANIFERIKQLQEQLAKNELKYEEYMDKIDSLAEEFDVILHEVWKVLMKLEMELFDQMEEVNQNFEHAMADLVNVFVEASQALFSQVRALEVSYSENISECALRYQTNANLNEEIVISDNLKPLMVDKDVLLNALATSHDMHMQLIDNREDTLICRSREWMEGVIEEIMKEEIKRNRGKVLEINYFLDLQREEFEVAAKESYGSEDDELNALLD